VAAAGSDLPREKAVVQLARAWGYEMAEETVALEHGG